MPLVDITVAGRRHAVQCGEGQETRLKRLAVYFDGKAAEIDRANPHLGEARLMLLTGLMVADELLDAYEELQRLRAEREAASHGQDAAAAQAIDRVAERLERLAAALETA
jgi:cell division protein ZapA